MVHGEKMANYAKNIFLACFRSYMTLSADLEV
jgi:hypothetical protein